MSMINAYSADAGAVSVEERALIARRERVLGPAYRLFYERPVHVVRGEGCWLYGPDGEAYLDAYNNVASVGHCHPHVVEAIARQAAVLNTHTRYLNELVVTYAERLAAKLPPEIGQVMFTCTGSEANDLALRIARAFTGGQGVIITETAYHGVTSAIAELSPSLGDGNPIGEHVRLVTAPDRRLLGEPVGQAFAAGVRAAVADLKKAGIRPAALLVDTIFSSDGVFAEPAGFLAEAVAEIRAAGGVFIADEVQPGFGRTGRNFWGFQAHGLVPDLVTMGKPMGGGHPMAAVAARPEVVEPFGRSCRYFNTFGGNPVSCAAGMAVLDVIEGESLMENCAGVGAYLQARLTDLAAEHPLIGEVRGAGLFIGVELVTNRDAWAPAAAEANRVVQAMRDRRVLISATGPRANVLKIRPPMPFNTGHADLLVDALAETLAEL
jgi:4-aminobutyrate aminotransferase-like enzyme